MVDGDQEHACDRKCHPWAGQSPPVVQPGTAKHTRHGTSARCGADHQNRLFSPRTAGSSCATSPPSPCRPSALSGASSGMGALRCFRPAPASPAPACPGLGAVPPQPSWPQPLGSGCPSWGSLLGPQTSSSTGIHHSSCPSRGSLLRAEIRLTKPAICSEIRLTKPDICPIPTPIAASSTFT